MPLSRRDLLGSLALLLGVRPVARAAPKDDRLVVDVSGNDPTKRVNAAIEALGGIGKFVRPGDYVVLKPNAGFANPPAWATTTEPQVLVALAKLCLDARAKQVLVAEFPLGKPDKCMQRSGIAGALQALPEVKVKLLGPDDFQTVKVKKGKSLQSVDVSKDLRSADVFINVPVAKAHNETGVSFGLKNHMGLIRDRKAFHTLLELDQAVADLAQVIFPHLTILDATRVLLTNGPAGPGETATPGRLIAGRNVVSVDAYGLCLARFNGKQMSLSDAPHIALAGSAGLGETDVSRLTVKKLSV